MPELEILINKFWSGTISREELKQLEKLLQEQQSGDGMSIPAGQKVQNILGPEKADDLLRKIHTDISAAGENGDANALRRKPLTLGHRLAGIAAGIALAIIFTWSWMNKDGAGRMKDNVQPGGIAMLTHTENNTDTIMHISLPDGSIVWLYPSSGISYYIPFIDHKRDITLRGAAEFKVTGDRLKPFTVYANGIATTALGTRFKVDVEKMQVHILLYEGKVVVQAANGSDQFKKAFLLPGQQLCVANNFDRVISGIQPIAMSAAVTKGKKTLHAHDAAPVPEDTTSMHFRNTPLSDVFDNLGKKFHVQIIYTEQDSKLLQEIPFTGQFNANDSLENLLKVLCGMNNLQYQLAGDKVNISHP